METIQEVLSQDEAHFKQRLEDDVEDVGSQQGSADADLPVLVSNGRLVLFPTSSSSVTDAVVIERVVVLLVPPGLPELLLPLPPLLLHANYVQHVAQVDERRR